MATEKKSRARINPKHADSVRERIKIKQLVNRLHDAAMGDIELTPGQVKAIEVLLNKSLPNLSHVEQHNTGELQSYLVVAPAPLEADQWSRVANPTDTQPETQKQLSPPRPQTKAPNGEVPSKQ